MIMHKTSHPYKGGTKRVEFTRTRHNYLHGGEGRRGGGPVCRVCFCSFMGISFLLGTLQAMPAGTKMEPRTGRLCLYSPSPFINR